MSSKEGKILFAPNSNGDPPCLGNGIEGEDPTEVEEEVAEGYLESDLLAGGEGGNEGSGGGTQVGPHHHGVHPVHLYQAQAHQGGQGRGEDGAGQVWSLSSFEVANFHK